MPRKRAPGLKKMGLLQIEWVIFDKNWELSIGRYESGEILADTQLSVGGLALRGKISERP